MNKKIFWIIIILAVILILIYFINQSHQKSEQTETIKIGAILPLTGIASIHGQNERQGIDLAVKEINIEGGIDGKKIEVIYEDDQTDPTKTLSAFKKLSEIDKVDVIIGGTWDILANAIIPEVDSKKIVTLSPSALPDTLTEKSPYFFSMHSPVAINQEIIEKFIINNSIKRIGIIVVNNPWGIAHLDTFKKSMQEINAVLALKKLLSRILITMIYLQN